MTSELEKQFLDTFRIKTKYIYYIKNTSIKLCYYSATKKDILKYFTNENHRKYKVFKVKIEHPKITDRILLELTAIHSTWCMPRLCALNVEELKKQVLSDLNLFNDKRIELIHQVQALFEEE
jgi:hypothetical protein